MSVVREVSGETGQKVPIRRRLFGREGRAGGGLVSLVDECHVLQRGAEQKHTDDEAKGASEQENAKLEQAGGDHSPGNAHDAGCNQMAGECASRTTAPRGVGEHERAVHVKHSRSREEPNHDDGCFDEQEADGAQRDAKYSSDQEADGPGAVSRERAVGWQGRVVCRGGMVRRGWKVGRACCWG